jgi:hypothetical protein
MNTPRLSRWTAVLAALLGSAALGACAVEAPVQKNDDAYQTEVTEACRACQEILVDCTSTSTNETQFVECRDQWLQCQQGADVGDTCGPPNDDDSCTMCRERVTSCKADGTNADQCDAQFSVCKAFLITRGDLAKQCTENSNTDPTVTCDVCRKDFTQCVSDAAGDNTVALCNNKFDTCKSANQLDASGCVAPSGAEGCLLCIDTHAACVAGAGAACTEDFSACTDSIAPLVSCDVDGGEPDPNAVCSHDSCEYGVALEDGCSPCATDVCAQDSYCCNTSAGAWDTYCLDIAAEVQSCGCSAPTDTCSHDACEYGDALTDGCNSCVTSVCAQDDFCCTDKWDTFCQDIAAGISVCGCGA